MAEVVVSCYLTLRCADAEGASEGYRLLDEAGVHEGVDSAAFAPCFIKRVTEMPRDRLPEPVGFPIEGYGALNANTTALAKRVLAGLAAEPSRANDDAAQTAVATVRQTLFNNARCS